MRSGLWTQVSRLGTHKKIHTDTHKIFSEGLLFFVDQDFYISVVEAEKSPSFS
jgi:hypothetical protein